MKSVFVVWATSGMYSDRGEWVVACYPDRDVAEEHARLANEWVKANVMGLRYPECSVSDRHGADYVAVEVPFCLHPDQYLDEVTKA